MCPYSHETAGSVLTQPLRNQSAATRLSPQTGDEQVDSRAQIPCRFYLAGSCLKGTSCPFAHTQTEVPEAIEGETHIADAIHEVNVLPEDHDSPNMFIE